MPLTSVHKEVYYTRKQLKIAVSNLLWLWGTGLSIKQRHISFTEENSILQGLRLDFFSLMCGSEKVSSLFLVFIGLSQSSFSYSANVYSEMSIHRLWFRHSTISEIDIFFFIRAYCLEEDGDNIQVNVQTKMWNNLRMMLWYNLIRS